ncbi:MAG: BamA/TamA family outer membrane protein [Myxococcota bacterium]|jgi:outer membrane protein assembly factor BamA|nr:BamA/TamA family outer membrane protein [Myxococcota bacterium]
MKRAFLAGLAVLLLVSATAGAEKAPDKPYRWFVFPIAGFDTDDGLGFGGRVEVQRIAEGYDPYRASVVIQAYLSLRGYHHHRFRLDLPGLGPRRNLRFSARVAFRQWLNDGYWGMGNGTAIEATTLGDLDDDDPGAKRYRYNLLQPYVFAMLRGDAPRKLNAFGTVILQYTRVTAYEGSLLAEHQPEGLQGGFSLQLSAGLVVDTRQPELAPDRGVLAEFSVRVSPHFPGGTGPFYGPFASLRHFVPVLPDGRFVLAYRVMAEWLFGDVPFYEMTRWGGSVPILGFGGWETLRGIPFGRYRAPGRAIANVEWRIEILRHPFFKSQLRWQLVPFVDVGAVWGAGNDATAESPDAPLHPAVGVGIHPVLAGSFMGRMDVAIAPERVVDGDGAVTQQFGWGFYLAFDQMF